MHPDLQRCLDTLDASTRGLSDEAGRQRVDGRWSIAEIVEHLERAFAGTAKGLDRCLESGTPNAQKFSWTHRFWTFVIVGIGYFPPGRPAPKHVVPTGTIPLAAALGAARDSLARLDDSARRARERFGSAKVLDHPVLGAFTVDEWRRFHWIHTRHHDRQIRARRRVVEHG